MKDRICVQQLLNVYQELYNKWYDFYLHHPEIWQLFKIGRKFVVAGLVLTACIRPSWFKDMFIDAYKGVVRHRGKELEIRNEILLYTIRQWYVYRKIYGNEWTAWRDYSYMHRVSARQAERIVKEMLGIEPRIARLACAAKLACEENLEVASRYYDTAGWYLRKVLLQYRHGEKTRQFEIKIQYHRLG